MDMKHFIILTGVTGNDVSVDINDITSIVRKKSREGYTYTSVSYGTEGFSLNVEESVKEIVRRINEVNNNLNK